MSSLSFISHNRIWNHHNQVLEDLTNMIIMWHDYVALKHYAVWCVLTHFFEDGIWCEKDPTSTLSGWSRSF